MRRALPLLLVLCCLPFAQSNSRAQGDETKIIALENLWNQMQLHHDAEAMGKLLDDDFVFTDYDGTVMSKLQFLESIRDKSYELSVEASDNMNFTATAIPSSSSAPPTRRERSRGNPISIRDASRTPG